MEFEISKAKVIIVKLCSVLAVIVLLDFLIPGTSSVEKVKSVEATREQYYNAARNYHHSYKIKTENTDSNVSEKFAKKIRVGDKIKLETSFFFREINSYERLKTSEKETYSLRIFSGLIIPLFFFIVTLLFYFKRTRRKTLLFVTGILMIANFIYVLL